MRTGLVTDLRLSDRSLTEKHEVMLLVRPVPSCDLVMLQMQLRLILHSPFQNVHVSDMVGFLQPRIVVQIPW